MKVKVTKKKRRNGSKAPEMYDFVIGIAAVVALAFYYKWKGMIDNGILITIVIGGFIILAITKAVFIITDFIEQEKNFISLFLLQEIRKTKVEDKEDLENLIWDTVEDLGKFSDAFYQVFKDK